MAELAVDQTSYAMFVAHTGDKIPAADCIISGLHIKLLTISRSSVLHTKLQRHRKF
jgi:hypothetical protein